MILSEVRNYLRQRRQASLMEIARHFDTDADVVRDMLEVWVRKGQVSKNCETGTCDACNSACNQNQPEIYLWMGRSR